MMRGCERHASHLALTNVTFGPEPSGMVSYFSHGSTPYRVLPSLPCAAASRVLPSSVPTSRYISSFGMAPTSRLSRCSPLELLTPRLFESAGRYSCVSRRRLSTTSFAAENFIYHLVNTLPDPPPLEAVPKF